MQDLSLHSEEEEHDEVQEENGPEDGNVEHGEEGEDDRDEATLDAGEPELELGQPARERAVLAPLLLAGRQPWERYGLERGGREREHVSKQRVSAARRGLCGSHYLGSLARLALGSLKAPSRLASAAPLFTLSVLNSGTEMLSLCGT